MITLPKYPYHGNLEEKAVYVTNGNDDYRIIFSSRHSSVIYHVAECKFNESSNI